MHCNFLRLQPALHFSSCIWQYTHSIPNRFYTNISWENLLFIFEEGRSIIREHGHYPDKQLNITFSLFPQKLAWYGFLLQHMSPFIGVGCMSVFTLSFNLNFTRGNCREVMAKEYDQNTLYKCVKFSKNICSFVYKCKRKGCIISKSFRLKL